MAVKMQYKLDAKGLQAFVEASNLIHQCFSVDEAQSHAINLQIFKVDMAGYHYGLKLCREMRNNYGKKTNPSE